MTNQINTPKVSIVMSFFKEPLRWIKYAVESIQNQTFTDFEFIVLCDNPNNHEGIEYLKLIEAKDRRIKLIINEENIGLTRSLNKGVSLTQGQYIARMDADDISLPQRLSMQVEYLDTHPDSLLCATDVNIINEKGKITRRNKYKRKSDQNWAFVANFISHPTIMFRRSLLNFRKPLYNEEYIYSQDYELWSKLILAGHRPYTIQCPLMLYRNSSAHISSQLRKEQNAFFKKAHRELIIQWIIQKKIAEPEECKDLETMLSKALSALQNTSGEDKRALYWISYVLYFSIGTYKRKFLFKFLFDRNGIVFNIPFILTFRLFFSRKTRRCRSGFL